MIFDAVDTAILLLNALAVWILIAAALSTAVLYALLAALWCAARAVVVAWRALVGRPEGVRAVDGATEAGAALKAADARVAVPAPTWARTDKEAA